ncbi:hypothetical protein JNB_01025 [Janibacter sp. HTCC2649]|nr:hypothetical protein JNB_01025 [Janibacter sp. HTCC2649]
MPAAVRTAFEAELRKARRSATSEQRWAALERAHILSQPWPWPHTQAHGVMLRAAWRDRDRRETIGQFVRLLVAAPGSALGRYPEGNTGRATVPLMAPMPLPTDLAEILADR